MKELKGDILLVKEGIICHQVNCLGIMGTGLAKQIKEKWIVVFHEYNEDCLKSLKICSSKYEMLGQCTITEVGVDKVIANIFGQSDVGRGKRTSYDAVDDSLTKLEIIITNEEVDNLPVYFPKNMGCGFGGGKWNIYYEIIKSHFPKGIIVKYEKGVVPY